MKKKMRVKIFVFCCFYGYLMIVRQHLQLWQEK